MTELERIQEHLYISMYRDMKLIRRFEEKVRELVNQNKIAGVAHEYIGVEAIVVGIWAALREDDVITNTHRGHEPDREGGRRSANDGRPVRAEDGLEVVRCISLTYPLASLAQMELWRTVFHLQLVLHRPGSTAVATPWRGFLQRWCEQPGRAT